MEWIRIFGILYIWRDVFLDLAHANETEVIPSPPPFSYSSILVESSVMAGSLDGFTTKFQLRSKENSESGVVSPRSLPPRKTINLILSHGIILNWNFERSVRTRDSFFIRGENLYIYNSRWEKICVHKLVESEPHLHIHSFFPPPRFSLSPTLWQERTDKLWCRSIPPPSTHSAISNRSASLFGFLEFHGYTELLFSPPPLYVTYQSISQTIISE